MSDSDQEQLIAQFVAVTTSSRYLAEQYLSRNNNDLMDAIEDFYANNGKSDSSEPTSAPPKRKKNNSGGIRTFRDLNDQEGESDDEKTNTNFFTGGEKSGLQVEDPNKDKKKGNDRSIIDQIFQRAKEQIDQPDDRPSAAQPDEPTPKFSGTAFKLGSDEQPSETIADPNAHLPKRPSKVSREITFWKQGFTVGEGPLHRYDDPNNESVLNELNRGRVPVSLLDVEFGQDVDVSVFRKTDEDWVPPKRKVGGFHGHGQRLGSPVPGEFTPTPEPAAATTAPEPTVEKLAPAKQEGEGDSLVQIRFANGKKVSHKFNSDDSIVKVYTFVRNHPFNDDTSRAFLLSHAFPVKPIEESESVTVADAKLKNAVIVQRWK